MFYIIALVFGGIWGSFSNVCINRLPKDNNVVTGRSYCPSCKNKISWFDNIPIFSFLILRGKCRSCKNKISFQYILVELIAAFSFLVIYYFYGFSFTTLLFFILTICFIIIFFIDLKHYIIPNEITYPLMALGFIKSFYPNINEELFPNYINSFIGGVLGYSIIWLLIFFYKKFRNKEGMGLGDAKLLSVIGFWFGWIAIPFVLFFSSLTALSISVPSLIKKTKKMSTQIPFGPYIIIGCLAYIFLLDHIKNFLI